LHEIFGFQDEDGPVWKRNLNRKLAVWRQFSYNTQISFWDDLLHFIIIFVKQRDTQIDPAAG
jgi:hypothetical protein